jgi:hypothetical protein
MDVSHQIFKEDRAVAHGGLVTVLEQAPGTIVLAVKIPRVSCGQAVHQFRQGPGPRFEQNVKMRGHQRPSVTGKPALFN